MRHPLGVATCAEAPHPVPPIGGFYPSLAGTFPAQLGPQIVFCVVFSWVRTLICLKESAPENCRFIIRLFADLFILKFSVCMLHMYFPSEVSESMYAFMLTHFVLAHGVSWDSSWVYQGVYCLIYSSSVTLLSGALVHILSLFYFIA